MVVNETISVKTAYRAVIILLALMVFPGLSQAAYHTRPAGGDAPTPVYVLIFVMDLDEVRTADQSFVANVFLEYRWQDPRLAHQEVAGRVKPLEDVWNPQLMITNQQRVMKTFPEVVSIKPDGEVTYRQRIWGTFSQPLKLADFPFDKQKFTLQLAAAGSEKNKIDLRSDPEGHMGIAEQLSVTDWKIMGWQARAEPYVPIPGKDTILSGFSFSINAERKAGYFIVKIILPLILIVAMSWVVFWIDPKESGVQISVAITSMLTLIAYRFAIGSDLPMISYLTRLDFFILSATILVFASLVEVIVTSTLAQNEKLGLARKLDLWSRWLFPALFAGIALKTFF
jgi:hypothetical protein